MKKLIFTATAVLGLGLFTSNSYAQLRDEKNVTITMDLQPILQLDMTTPDQIDFVFSNINDYYGGIIKYGGTILKVSASVNWDLWAVGTSLQNMSTGARFWDVQSMYGTGFDLGGGNAVNQSIPLTALELHQSPDNVAPLPGVKGVAPYPDYSSAFVAPSFSALPAGVTPGQNSIYVTSGDVFLPPAASEKYIQGQNGVNNYVQGGSYLTNSLSPLAANNASPPATSTLQTQNTNNSTVNAFYNVIDYRIYPGLPAIFPQAAQNDGATLEKLVSPNYAQPGYYTMNVKYILSENQ
jgi:hypothetical protein